MQNFDEIPPLVTEEHMGEISSSNYLDRTGKVDSGCFRHFTI